MAKRWSKLLTLVAAALAALGVVAYVVQRPPRTEEEARRRLSGLSPRPSEVNVVLVTLDTLRADRLACYGFRGIETPHLDGLAREGVLFESETASVPLTLPSHASILTGLLPPHHGVRDNGGFFLAEDKTTLAERLKAAGFTTGAFVAAWVLDGRWGLKQGFDRYSDKFDLSKFKVISLGSVQKPGDEVMDDALGWLETVRDRRFFSWIHLYDPHTPYEPPEPFKSRYPGQPYLGEVAYTDKVVGRLLGWLKERRLDERTVVVVTADHGESLGDHGEATHAFFIYDATVRVPLIIRTPWGLRGRVKAQTSSVDLFPTIVELAGLPPEEGIDGRSLVRALFDPASDLGRQGYSETYFTRFHYGWQHLRSLRNGSYKYIEAPSPELYDLRADPLETKNIYKEYSARAEELRLALEKLAREKKAAAAPDMQKLDPDTLQRLAALGYVGTTVEVDPEAVLPDPKDKLRLYTLMNAAKGDAQEERLDAAIEKMGSVLAEDRGIIDAHLALGNWLAKARRGDEAVAAFKEVLGRQPANDVAMLNLAHIYRGRGQNDAALEGYRSVLKLDPGNGQARYQLATLLLDIGRPGDAEKEFRACTVQNPEMGAAWNSLGALAFQRGHVEEATRLVAKGLELEPRVRFGAYNEGRILEARGDRARAAAAYRRELEVYPDHGKARFNLAQLLREGGDRAGYLAELRAGTEKSPDFGPCFFFLAREELRAGRVDEAFSLATRGLEADGRSDVAALGHYVRADVLNGQGKAREAQAEVQKARALEGRGG